MDDDKPHTLTARNTSNKSRRCTSATLTPASINPREKKASEKWRAKKIQQRSNRSNRWRADRQVRRAPNFRARCVGTANGDIRCARAGIQNARLPKKTAWCTV